MGHHKHSRTALNVLKAMATPPPADPEAAKTATRIKNIEKVTSAARSNWFWFFSVLGYIIVTIIGLSDGALFTPSATAELPILGFSVNLRAFLLLAPVLITVVFVYLHGVIEMLWEDLSNLPDRVDIPKDKPDGGEPVVSILPVWLLLEFALIRRDKLRGRPKGQGAVQTSFIGTLSAGFIAFLIWVGAPITLGWLWWTSLVMHDLTLSLVQAACVLLCTTFGWMSAVQMKEEMRENA